MWLAVTHELEAPETANKAHVWEQRMQRVAAPGFPVLGDGWSSLAARDARAQASGSGHVALGWQQDGAAHTSPVLIQGLGQPRRGLLQPRTSEGEAHGWAIFSPSAPPVSGHTSSPLLMISISKGQRARIWAKSASPEAGCGVILVISMPRDLPVWQ